MSAKESRQGNLLSYLPCSKVILKFVLIALLTVTVVGLSLFNFTYRHAQDNYYDQIALMQHQQAALFDSLIKVESTRLLAFGELWTNYIYELSGGEFSWDEYEKTLETFIHSLPPDAFIDQVVVLDEEMRPLDIDGSQSLHMSYIQNAFIDASFKEQPITGMYCRINCYIYAMIPQPADSRLKGALFLRAELTDTLFSFSDLSKANIGLAMVVNRDSMVQPEHIVDFERRHLARSGLGVTQLTDFDANIDVLHELDLEIEDWVDQAAFNPYGLDFELDGRFYNLQVLYPEANRAFFLIVLKEVTELHKKNTQTIFEQGWISGLLLLLVVALFTIYIARLARRIKFLAEQMPRIGQGLFNEVAVALSPQLRPTNNFRYDELDDLTDSTMATVQQLSISEQLKSDTENKDREKTRYLSKINHEIRSLMTPIIGYASRATHNMSAKELQELLERMRLSAEMLKRLSSLVLDVAKVESGKIDLTEDQVNLYSYIPNTVGMVCDIAGQKNIRLSVVVFEDVPPWIEIDATLLQHIIINLLQNAIKYTEEGHVRLIIKARTSTSLQENQMYLELSVIDEGIGMSAEELAHINDFLYQSDSTRPGYGVGLYITNNFINALHGRLTVRSKEGRGSEFDAILPITVLPGRLVDQPKPSDPSILIISPEMDIAEYAYDTYHTRQDIQIATPIDIPKLYKKFDAVIIYDGEDLDTIHEVFDRLVTKDATVVIHNMGNESDPIIKEGYGFIIYRRSPLTPHTLAPSLAVINNRRAMQTATMVESEKTAHPLRILVTEDEFSIREMITDILADRGHTVVGVENGVQALKQLSWDNFDVALIDRNMPGISGEEVIRIFHDEHPDKPPCRCIIMSADDKPYTRDELEDIGAHSFVSKPFNNVDLFRAIENPEGDSIYTSESSHEDTLMGSGSQRLISKDVLASRKPKNIRQFLQTSEEDALKLREHADANDVEGFWDCMHRLKGSAAIFGFSALSMYVKNQLDERPDEGFEEMAKIVNEILFVSKEAAKRHVPLGDEAA